MENVYFCQFSNLLDNNIYLPYSVGIIKSYLQTNSIIQKKYNIDILFIKENITSILQKIDNPKYIFMSVYMWNFKYSVKVAKTIKLKYPKVKIVLGGHHVPYFDFGFFKEYPQIDILVHGEGERVCEQILIGNCLYSINNISFQKCGKTINTKKLYNNDDLNIIPSSYLTDVYKDILKLPYNFSALLETNRGCPYGCAYCDWGSTLTSQKKLRTFNKERVFNEIEWFGKNKIGFVFGTDSNFGILKSDMEYIDFMIETKKKYGYPQKFRVCYAKNSDDFIFEINKKLNEVGLSKGATLSFQSLNSNSIKAVGRKNISLEKFNELLLKYKKEDIPTYTEMILGLPLETYDSFADGLCKLLDYGQDSSIVTYYCQVYPNSRINEDEFRKKYNIETIKIPMYPTHTTINDKSIDEEEIIISSNTMSRKEWVETCLFSWAIQTFHCLGITRIEAKYLHEHNISYKEFYNSILEYCKNNPDSLIGGEYYKVKSKYEAVQNGEGFKYIIDGFNWTFEEGSFIKLIYDIKTLYEDIYQATHRLEDDYTIYNLLQVNKFLLKLPIKCNKLIATPIIRNIMKYLGFDIGIAYNIIGEKTYGSIHDYAIQEVWYGRKGSDMLFSNTNIKIEKG